MLQENKIIDSTKYQMYLGTNVQARTSFVIELDDAKDIDILKSLLDPFLPPNLILLNTQFDLFNYNW